MLTRRQLLTLPVLLKAGCSVTRESTTVDASAPDTTGPRMATFHYGGTIPTPWPPTSVSGTTPTVYPPPSIPYLTETPGYSIDVNTGHQLFVDDFLLASTTSATRKFFSGEPAWPDAVLSPTESFEQLPGGFSVGSAVAPSGCSFPFSDGVYPLFPGSPRLFALSFAGGNGLGYTVHQLSDDWGRTWHSKRVVIDHGAYPGTGIPHRDSASLVYMPSRSDGHPWIFIHSKRLNDINFTVAVRKSTNGRDWSDVLVDTLNVGVGFTVFDRVTAGYNPFRNKVYFSFRYFDDVGRRTRRYFECDEPTTLAGLANIADPSYNVMWDRAHWGAVSPAVSGYDGDYMYPDSSGAPEIYNRDMCGEIWGPQGRELLSLFLVDDTILRGQSPTVNRPKYNEVVGGFSRDGFYANRQHGYFPFGRLGTARNAWNWGNMQSVNGPVIDMGNGRVRRFVTGRRGFVGDSGNASSGDCTMGAFDWRKDGWACMELSAGGQLVTRTLTHASTRNVLYVNADVPRNGSLRVEVLKSDGSVVPGCSLADCAPITGDSTTYKVTFDARRIAQPDIPDTFKLRFVGDGGARLYSFWTASENDRGTTT
jgi:hypothetical protein